MGHGLGECGADPNAASFVKHAKALGVPKTSFDLTKRWASILKRYWLAGGAHFTSCIKFSVALDDSRFQTLSICAIVGDSSLLMSPSWWLAHRSTQARILDTSNTRQHARRRGYGCAGVGRLGLWFGICWGAQPRILARARSPGRIPEVSRTSGKSPEILFGDSRSFPEIPGNPWKPQHCKLLSFCATEWNSRKSPEL